MIKPHHFYFDNNEVQSGIVYDMIIGRDLMVHTGIQENFKRQVLNWDGANVPMNEPSVILGQGYLTSRKMRKVAMNTEEQVYTREATDRMVIIFKIHYSKVDIEQLSANTIQLNYDERIQLLGLLTYFEQLFDGNSEEWDT